MKNIEFKKKTCMNQYGEQTELTENIIPLYIVTTRKCNTHCKFCTFHNGKSDIDLVKLKEAIDWLYRFCSIPTVHFTGGEPTLELEKIVQISDFVKQNDKLTTTSVNTNGTRLNDLINIESLDNIALSRHCLTDEENFEIFGSNKVPTLKQIDNFKDKYKIHLSCNLIKGYVDSYEKIIQYLENAASVGVNDTGFVSLMRVNDFCNKHFVDFSNFDIKETERFKKVRCFTNIDDETQDICCKCENYLYMASNFKLVSMYHRYAIQNDRISDYLVYEDNQLKQGFNGQVIEWS